MTAESTTGEVTRLLHALRAGDRTALDALLPRVYDELRAVARGQLRRHGGRDGGTLQATAVVHEAYLKLSRAGIIEAQSRAHFMAIAATAMRQVVVDHARAMLSQKRGGGWKQTTLTTGSASYELRPEEMIALDQALQTLDERQRRIVECRYFAGMEEAEVAEALGVSDRTVRREWVKARAWLYTALYPHDSASGAP
jgi:RNA polymerase sigma factor (TIGR02999 family)